jgi:hypothetical protein
LIGIGAANCRAPWNFSSLTCVSTFSARRS